MTCAQKVLRTEPSIRGAWRLAAAVHASETRPPENLACPDGRLRVSHLARARIFQQGGFQRHLPLNSPFLPGGWVNIEGCSKAWIESIDLSFLRVLAVFL
jgi:hypothetical protein